MNEAARGVKLSWPVTGTHSACDRGLAAAGAPSCCPRLSRAGCDSESNARPGADSPAVPTTAPTTTTTASTTTQFAAAPTTSPLLAPPVTAPLGGQPATFRRVDLPLELSAPANLLAASPNGVVAIGFRSVGCCGLGVTSAFSTDGRQWRPLATPWERRTIGTGTASSFGNPIALVYGDGMFLSVGQWVDVADDGKQTATAFAAIERRHQLAVDRSPPDSRLAPPDAACSLWRPVDHGHRIRGRCRASSAPLFSSIDGTTWGSHRDPRIRGSGTHETGFGLMAISGEINSSTPSAPCRPMDTRGARRRSNSGRSRR